MILTIGPYATLIHYTLIALIVIITAIGISIGQSIIGRTAAVAIDIQPDAQADIRSIMLLGMSLMELAAIVGTLVAARMFMSTQYHPPTIYFSLAEFGTACAACFTGFVLSIASSFPAKSALMTVARQPLIAARITRLALVSLAIMQTPLVFAFVITLFIQNQAEALTSVAGSLRLIGAGLSIGLGTLGPIIGLAIVGNSACKAIGQNRAAYKSVMFSTIVGQAFVETAVVFALMISFFSLFLSRSETIMSGFSALAAALCIALGTSAAGICSSKIAARINYQLAENPILQEELTKVGLLSIAWVEVSILFSFIIAITIMFVT